MPKINLIRNITKLDWMAIKEISRLPNFNDDTIHQASASSWKGKGLKVRPQSEFLRHLFPQVGVLTKRQPNAAEYADIEFGMTNLKVISSLDIGQTLVVRDRIVVAVEAFRGH